MKSIRHWLFNEPVHVFWDPPGGYYASRWTAVWVTVTDILDMLFVYPWEFLFDHPLLYLLVEIVLCSAASFGTIVLLAYLKTAGYIP